MKILWMGKFDGQKYRAEYSMSSVLPGNQWYVPVNYIDDKRSLSRLSAMTGEPFDVVFIQGGREFDPGRIDTDIPVVFFASEADLKIALPIIHTGKIKGVIAHCTRVRDYCIKERIPCVRMLNGYDPLLYYPVERTMIHDISIIASITDRRHSFIQALRSDSRKLKINVMTSFDPVVVNQVYNESKIVVHVHAIAQSYIPSRLFEVRATNAVMLCEWIHDWHDDLIFAGFDMFSTSRDLLNMIDMYLSDEGERKRMVSVAQKVNRLNTWENRVGKITDFIERIL